MSSSLFTSSISFRLFESIYRKFISIDGFLDTNIDLVGKELKENPVQSSSSLYKGIPEEIRQHYEREKSSNYQHFYYPFTIGDRHIHLYTSILKMKNVHAYEDDGLTTLLYDIYARVYHIMTLLNEISEGNGNTNSCSKTLRIYLLLTPYTKQLPANSNSNSNNNNKRGIVELNYMHCNTAMTYSCAHHNDIVVFRDEEWCKVLIHECMHAMGFDFSMIDPDFYDPYMKKQMFRGIDPRSKSLAPYEAYTETWAQILFHILDITMAHKTRKSTAHVTIIQIKRGYKEFQSRWHQETWWSLYQCAKVLHYYDITYRDLIYSGGWGSSKRYLEKHTNVFAYYVLRPIFMMHLEEFLTLCHSLQKMKKKMKSIQTKKTTALTTTTTKQSLYRILAFPNDTKYDIAHEAISKFLEFIEKYYRQSEWIELIDTEFAQLFDRENKNINHIPPILQKSLRLTIPL